MADKVQHDVEHDDGPSELDYIPPEIIPSGLLPYFGPNVSKWMLDDALSKIRLQPHQISKFKHTIDNNALNVVTPASDC